ncbi:MAG: DsbC family protein [Nitrosomonadales bacterium]|nr:DsbC family protein [Nitrosomonadales bacterium]
MFRSLLLLLALFAVGCAHASEATVKETLEKKYPQIGKVDKVHKAKMLGLYEVVMDGQLFYTDEKTQYLISGSIFELKSGRNLTEERSRELFSVDFNSLPLELAVKRVKGNGSRKLAYLTDPNCGFCKKLEGELKHVDNVTLYRFLFPIFQGSDEKVRNILCSPDPSKAWEDWMLDGVQPPAGNCATPQTEKVQALGAKLHVTGTPTLVFANGKVVPGFLPAAELEKALNAPASH